MVNQRKIMYYVFIDLNRIEDIVGVSPVVMELQILKDTPDFYIAGPAGTVGGVLVDHRDIGNIETTKIGMATRIGTRVFQETLKDSKKAVWIAAVKHLESEINSLNEIIKADKKMLKLISKSKPAWVKEP